MPPYEITLKDGHISSHSFHTAERVFIFTIFKLFMCLWQSLSDPAVTMTTGLLRAGAMKEEDKPLWYDIYKAFPPKYEPRFDRKAPDIQIKNIFYPEDIIRSKFHKAYKNIGAANLGDHRYQTSCQKFISIYNNLQDKDNNVSEEELFQKAMEIFDAQNVATPRRRGGPEYATKETFVSKFQEAQQNQKSAEEPAITVDIKNIFKE